MTNEFRIHGPPGTGKTTYLAAWVERAAQRFGSERVVVSSFTKAAAVELVRRGLPVDDHNVGTLHALCYRALGRPKLVEDSLADWNAHAPLYALSGVSGDNDDLAAQARAGATWGDQLLAQAQNLRARIVPRGTWPDHAVAFHDRWCAWKREAGLMDFTDLIEQALEVLPRAPGDPDVLFVDESQDLAPLELALVRRWGEHTEFFVTCGDADQALFTFKGAEPRAFLEPELPPENVRVLSQSYRVPRAVHAKAKRWIERCSYRYPSEYHPRDCDGELRASDASTSYPDAVVREVEDLPPFDTGMVLASCAYMLAPTIRLLRERGVLFHNPYRLKNGAWNPTRGGVERLRDFLRVHPAASGADHRRWWTWSELARWVELLVAKDVLKLGSKGWSEARAKDRETRDVELTHADLAALFEPACLDELVTAAASDDPTAMVRWLRRRLLAGRRELVAYALAVVDRKGARRLFAEPNVVVGTCHSTKGAEASAVWLFPDLSPQADENWLRTGEPRDSVLRTFYVGMTRAKEQLTLCSPARARSVEW